MSAKLYAPLAVSVSLLAIIAFSFMFALTAHAATITDVTFNGDPNLTGNTNETVTARFRVLVGASENIESIETDFIGDSRTPVCFNVQDEIQNGIREFDVPVKLPQSSGNYDLQVKTFGIFGAGADQDCQTSANGTATFNDRVTVVYGNDSTSGAGSSVTTQSGDASLSGGTADSTSSVSQWDSLMALITSLIASLKAPVAPAAPVASPLCAQYAPYAGLTFGESGSAVTALQQFLLANGAPIPALSQGAGFGYYGGQTASAVSVFKAANKCQ